jgi:ribosomal protein S27E
MPEQDYYLPIGLTNEQLARSDEICQAKVAGQTKKLTEEQKIMIIQLYCKKVNQEDIAKRLGVTLPQVIRHVASMFLISKWSGLKDAPRLVIYCNECNEVNKVTETSKERISCYSCGSLDIDFLARQLQK